MTSVGHPYRVRLHFNSPGSCMQLMLFIRRGIGMFSANLPRWLFLVSFLSLDGLYLALTRDLSQFDTFWSPESGVRFALSGPGE